MNPNAPEFVPKSLCQTKSVSQWNYSHQTMDVRYLQQKINDLGMTNENLIMKYHHVNSQKIALENELKKIKMELAAVKEEANERISLLTQSFDSLLELRAQECAARKNENLPVPRRQRPIMNPEMDFDDDYY
jgi:predicted nuclease with TOPRIM domain